MSKFEMKTSPTKVLIFYIVIQTTVRLCTRFVFSKLMQLQLTKDCQSQCSVSQLVACDPKVGRQLCLTNLEGSMRYQHRFSTEYLHYEH